MKPMTKMQGFDETTKFIYENDVKLYENCENIF